jgi:hypothetical protein
MAIPNAPSTDRDSFELDPKSPDRDVDQRQALSPPTIHSSAGNLMVIVTQTGPQVQRQPQIIWT